MSDTIDLDKIRQEAIDNNRSFGVTRLKDEFRMKPSPDAEPYSWVKSPYSSRKNPVYLVADCIPMKDILKRKPTAKQLIARKISGIKAKLRSQLHSESDGCRKFLSALPPENILYLDTETTGLGNENQIIEMAIVDQLENVLFESRFNPTVPIQQEAVDVHGITADQLKDAPNWPDRFAEIKGILTQENTRVVIFNSSFDTSMLAQTCMAFDLDADWVSNINTLCAMDLAADIFGPSNRYGTISLRDACYEADVKWRGHAHSALADTLATKDLVNNIAKLSLPLHEELAALEAEKMKLATDKA